MYIGDIADEPSQNGSTQDRTGQRSVVEQGSAALDLRGSMPCAGCGYELSGLSIRSSCSECGLPVRATLLVRVDPQAPELAPVYRPIVRVIGLSIWVLCGSLALLIAWALRFDDALTVVSTGVRQARWMAPLGAVALVGAGVGTLAFVGATGSMRRRASLLAILGVLLHLPLAWLFWRIQVDLDSLHPVPYFDAAFGGVRGGNRALTALGFNLVLVTIVLCLRPAARTLVRRSAVLRGKAVDRQTLLAMSASLTVGSVGYLLLWASWSPTVFVPDGTASLGTVLVGLGSVLLTIASIGAAYDTLLLMPVILRKPLSLEDVFTKGKPGA